MANELVPYNFSLSGKLITAVDQTVIGDNFQSLKNLRYTEVYPEGIGGMTAINSTAPTTGGTTYLDVNSIYQFVKDQPVESHVLVHAFNSSGKNPKIFDNTSTVPSTGDFTATPIFTLSDTTTIRTGVFSEAPQGNVAFCDGRDSLIWGGNEGRLARFINYAPDASFFKDYTVPLQNTLYDSQNIATLTWGSTNSADSNTKLLLHFDSNLTDSSTGSHAVTGVGGIAYNAVTKKFGTHSIQLTGDYLHTPDNAVFDFSGGSYSIDLWMFTAPPLTDYGIYYQEGSGGSTEHFKFYLGSSGELRLDIDKAGTSEIRFATASNIMAGAKFEHVELTQSSTNLYIFVDGVQKANIDIASSSYPANLGSTIIFGATNEAGTSNLFAGWWDELRISDAARHTSNFEPPERAYGGVPLTYSYIGATRPLKGMKFYIDDVGTKNGTTGTMSIYEWTGSGWTGTLAPTLERACVRCTPRAASRGAGSSARRARA